MKKKTLYKSFLKLSFCVLVLSGVIIPNANAQKTKLTLDLAKPGANVSPMLYGLMTEEINHSYDGGLYDSNEELTLFIGVLANKLT